MSWPFFSTPKGGASLDAVHRSWRAALSWLSASGGRFRVSHGLLLLGLLALVAWAVGRRPRMPFEGFRTSGSLAGGGAGALQPVSTESPFSFVDPALWTSRNPLGPPREGRGEPGHDMMSSMEFSPLCCPSEISSQGGCACMSLDQKTFLIERGGNNPSSDPAAF